jgi:hypothetical protein
MSELPDTIESMPSEPQQKSLQQTPSQPKPKPVNLGALIGFFLCAVCLLAFPKYANLDNLGTGIFYGMGLMVLFMWIIWLSSEVARQVSARQVRRNKPSKATEAGPGSGTPRRKRRLYSIVVSILCILVGLCLLAFPGETNMGDLSTQIYGVGLIVLLVGIIGLSTALSRRSRDRRLLEAAAAGSDTRAQEQQRRSNGIRAGIFLLLFGVCLLALPQGTNMGALSRGIFYGMGLIVLLITIIALSSTVSRRITGTVSPGQ